MWDLEKPAAPPAVLTHSAQFNWGAAHEFRFTPDGRRMYRLLFPGRAVLWKLDGSGQAIDPVELPDPEGPDQQRLAIGQSPKETSSQVVVPSLAPLCLPSPDGRWLIDAGRDGKVRLWDLMRPEPFGNPAHEFDSRSSLPSLSSLGTSRSPFSTESQWLVSTDEQNLHLWDLRDNRGTELTRSMTIRLEPGVQVRGVAVDATGRWVAIAGSDDQFHIREVTSEGCVERSTLQPASGRYPWSEYFLSPGGKRLVDLSTSPPRIYRLPLDDLKEAAQQAVGRNLTRDEWRRFFPGQDYHKTFEALPEPPP
jgi:WD40 repeat protein